MKKDLIVHFAYLIAFFTLVVLFRGWFGFGLVLFALGGLVGLFLPDVDQFVYVYFLRPADPASRQARSLFNQKKFFSTWSLLVSTRAQRTKLIFHTAYFQLIFLLLCVLVMTSSGSYFGMGLVLSFALHLLTDQVIDFMENKNLTNWFTDLPITMDGDRTRVYLIANIAALCFLGFFL